MERRAALLVSAATTIVGTGSTIALAAFGGAGLLGFGTAFGSPDVAAVTPARAAEPSVTTTTQATQVVTKFQDQYDQIVVHVPDPASEPASDEAPPPPPTSIAPRPTSTPSAPTTAPEERGDDRDDEGHDASRSSDPVPPAGCIDGQLEDNGVWNCQH